MRRETVWFVGPRALQVRDDALSAPGPEEVVVRVELSGISAGTEMLLYRGELPDPNATDIDPVVRGLKYPTPFGYCAVGRVSDVGARVDPIWRDRLVFACQPHASAYHASVENLVPVPDGTRPQDAVFLANTETAVCLAHDAAPLLGERVLVLGQGTVGLLTAALLSEFPLACLVTADMHPVRRSASEKLGVAAVLDPAAPDFLAGAGALAESRGFDIVIELTGDPSALGLAVELAAFSGRIIVGSWYGRRRAPLDLGGRFHRSRIRLQSSQVSTISPELSGRWDKGRRFAVAWAALQRLRPSAWITQRFPVDRAAEAYQLLDTSPQSTIQVVLEYPGSA